MLSWRGQSKNQEAATTPCPEGGFTCWIEEMPEVISQGDTFEEARVNLRDALNLMVEYRHDEARAQIAPSAVIEELAVA
jgi:predicted RNase H-like HicB family nuclease